jgi:hypothetical protein
MFNIYNSKFKLEILGFHGHEYEDGSHPGCSAV